MTTTSTLKKPWKECSKLEPFPSFQMKNVHVPHSQNTVSFGFILLLAIYLFVADRQTSTPIPIFQNVWNNWL